MVDVITFFDKLQNAIIPIIIANKNVFLYSIPIVLGLLLFEAIYFGWQESSIRRIIKNPSRSNKLDLAICSLQVLKLDELLYFVASLGLVSLIPNLAKEYFGFNFLKLVPNVYLQIIIYLLIYDFLWYWFHRFSHKVAWLWHLHEVHHSTTDMNLITANRVHPVGQAIVEILFAIPLALLGAPPAGFATAKLIAMAHAHLLHSNFPWTWGWIGKYVVVSPIAHQIHHSADMRQQNSNYGFISPLWDHIFGTRSEDTAVLKKVEEADNLHNNPWYYYLWQSYYRSARSLLRLIKKIFR